MNPEQLQQLIVPILFAVFIYLFLIRPQNKREKEVTEMRENLKVGDRVVTIGGIIGEIIVLKEDLISIESGTSKTRIETTRWAIGSVLGEDEIT